MLEGAVAQACKAQLPGNASQAFDSRYVATDKAKRKQSTSNH
jgi:hypothetical protein